MSIVVEAIFESGVLKPLSPLPQLKEHERVRVTIEESNLVDELCGKIEIDPAVAREIIESAEYGIFES